MAILISGNVECALFCSCHPYQLLLTLTSFAIPHLSPSLLHTTPHGLSCRCLCLAEYSAQYLPWYMILFLPTHTLPSFGIHFPHRDTYHHSTTVTQHVLSYVLKKTAWEVVQRGSNRYSLLSVGLLRPLTGHCNQVTSFGCASRTQQKPVDNPDCSQAFFGLFDFETLLHVSRN